MTYEFFILEKPFHSLFSSGSIFMIDFFFSFWVFFLLITFFKDRVFFTSGLLDKINSYKRIIHIFVFIIPHNHTVYAREPMNVGKGDGEEEAACPFWWKVGWFWPRVSHLGTLLVAKVIRLPF